MENIEQKPTVILDAQKMYIHTAFGIVRTTIYFLIGALGAIAITRKLGEPSAMTKLLLLASGFVFSWLLIFLDYKFFLRKMSITIKK